MGARLNGHGDNVVRMVVQPGSRLSIRGGELHVQKLSGIELLADSPILRYHPALGDFGFEEEGHRA